MAVGRHVSPPPSSPPPAHGLSLVAFQSDAMDQRLPGLVFVGVILRALSLATTCAIAASFTATPLAAFGIVPAIAANATGTRLLEDNWGAIEPTIQKIYNFFYNFYAPPRNDAIPAIGIHRAWWRRQMHCGISVVCQLLQHRYRLEFDHLLRELDELKCGNFSDQSLLLRSLESSKAMQRAFFRGEPYAAISEDSVKNLTDTQKKRLANFVDDLNPLREYFKQYDTCDRSYLPAEVAINMRQLAHKLNPHIGSGEGEMTDADEVLSAFIDLLPPILVNNQQRLRFAFPKKHAPKFEDFLKDSNTAEFEMAPKRITFQVQRANEDGSISEKATGLKLSEQLQTNRIKNAKAGEKYTYNVTSFFVYENQHYTFVFKEGDQWYRINDRHVEMIRRNEASRELKRATYVEMEREIIVRSVPASSNASSDGITANKPTGIVRAGTMNCWLNSSLQFCMRFLLNEFTHFFEQLDELDVWLKNPVEEKAIVEAKFILDLCLHHRPLQDAVEKHFDANPFQGHDSFNDFLTKAWNSDLRDSCESDVFTFAQALNNNLKLLEDIQKHINNLKPLKEFIDEHSESDQVKSESVQKIRTLLHTFLPQEISTDDQEQTDASAGLIALMNILAPTSDLRISGKITRHLQHPSITTIEKIEREDFFHLFFPDQTNSAVHLNALFIPVFESPQEGATIRLEEGGPDTPIRHEDFRFETAPNAFFSTVKRYATGTRLDREIITPAEITLRGDYEKLNNEDYLTYEVDGIIVHVGSSMNCGHYYAYIKKEGQWFRADDDRVERVTEEQAFEDAKRNCYIYHFTRKSEVPEIIGAEIIERRATVG